MSLRRKSFLSAFVTTVTIFIFSAIFTALAEEPTSIYIRQAPNADTVIIFVHGFGGDGVSTWTNNETNTYWPIMVTHDHTFDGVDIFVYSYSNGLVSSLSSSLSIDELAANMRYVLVSQGITNYKKIIFLSHSLGGLITRAYLLDNRDVAEHTLFAYFYSTPTTGSQIASLTGYFFNTPQLQNLGSLSPDAYIADLIRHWLDAEFKFPSYCAYEKKPTNGITLVVSMGSAVALCTKHIDPIDADHFQIVKPSSQNSASYIAFKAAYAETTIPALKAALNEQEKRRKSRVQLGVFLEEGQIRMEQCANELGAAPRSGIPSLGQWS